MSSYLNFYYVLKEGDSKPLNFMSVSRSSELYSYFHDNLNVPWCGSDDDEKFSKLSRNDVKIVMDDLNGAIKKTRNRLVEYEKYAGSNPDYIDEILSSKEYIEELEYVLSQVMFFDELLNDIEFNCCNSFKEIVMNIG